MRIMSAIVHPCPVLCRSDEKRDGGFENLQRRYQESGVFVLRQKMAQGHNRWQRQEPRLRQKHRCRRRKESASFDRTLSRALLLPAGTGLL